jgi:hypothetical protein
MRGGAKGVERWEKEKVELIIRVTANYSKQEISGRLMDPFLVVLRQVEPSKPPRQRYGSQRYPSTLASDLCSCPHGHQIDQISACQQHGSLSFMGMSSRRAG